MRFGRPVASGGGAAVEYWTTYTEDGAPQTLARCVLMSFDASGEASESRADWHAGEEIVEPPPGLVGGPDEGTRSSCEVAAALD